jgi:hypothetical protein
MSQGANKKFLAQRERFLRENVIIVKNPQQHIAVTEGALDGVHEFDLVENPALNFRDATGRPVKSYSLQLFATRKGLDLALGALGAGFKDSDKGFNTHVIKAYYLAWDNDRHYETQLGDQADFMFTPTLDGCSFVVGSGRNPKVSHLNYQNASQRIDQREIKRRIQTEAFNDADYESLTVLKQKHYNPNSHAEKTAGKTTELTVAGFRDKQSGTWRFFYQKRTREAVDGARGAEIHEILADRLVPIV